MLYCFLDTNIFIHCQDIKDIDWQSELGVSEICLVIAPVVFEELDVFKDDPRNNRKRNRARSAISFLETVLDSPDQTVRDGVTLEYAEEMPAIEFGIYNLNSINNDDRLVASAICWSQTHVDSELILVSHDSGPRMKAKQREIRAKELSVKYRLKDQLDEKDKKIRKLEDDVLRLRSSQPKLQLGFADSNGEILDFLRAEAMAPKDSIVERLITRALPQTERFRRFLIQFVTLPLTLQNSGDALAVGVEISLRIRSEIETSLIAPANIPVSATRSLYFTITEFSGDPRARARANAVRYGNWKLETDNQNIKLLKFRIEKIKPHDSIDLDPIYIVFGVQNGDLDNFPIEYDIVKDSTGPRQGGDLHIVIDRKSA